MVNAEHDSVYDSLTPCPITPQETTLLQQDLMRVAQMLVIRADAGSAIYEMPVSQVKCLRIIAEREGQKLREVAATLGLSLPGVSRMVDRLVKAGLVARQVDPHDRRAVQLETTVKSRAYLDELRVAREARLAACTRHLTPEEMCKILDGLRLLADAAERARAEEGGCPAREACPVTGGAG